MLELARRNMQGPNTIKVFDNEMNVVSFQDLTVEDITGIGRIKPVAARHFAEQAELIQNLTALTGSGLWPTVQPHFSSIKLAQIVEEIFNLKDYEVVLPFIALTEQAEGQKQAQVLQEDVATHATTATDIGDDFDMDFAPTALPPATDQLPQEPAYYVLMDWTSHLKDPEEKAKFESEVRGCKQVFLRLETILNNLEKGIDRSETSIQVYDTPNWDVRQAHKKGNRETLGYLKQLIRSTYDG